MAIIIKPNGVTTQVLPTNGEVFPLEFLQKIVEGYLEEIPLLQNFGGEVMYVDEDAKEKNSPINPAATMLSIYNQWGGYVRGTVIICAKDEIE